MRFAAATDMEPGMWFRAHAGAEPDRWFGVERIVSRFPGKRRVRVLCRVPFVCDVDARFQVIDWSGGQ